MCVYVCVCVAVAVGVAVYIICVAICGGYMVHTGSLLCGDDELASY